MPTTADLVRDAHQSRRRAFASTEIRLSEAGGCARRQTLRILGYPAAPHSERQLAIFSVGDLWEDWLAAIWQRRYPGQVERQVGVPTPFGTGHIDLWVAPERLIVECKTTREASRPYLPLAEHVSQVTLYLHYWGLERDAAAEIAYVLKETGEVISIPVEYDADRAARLVRRLERIQQAVTAGTPLPVPTRYAADRFPCAWKDGRCQYWQHCWGGKDGSRDV